MKKKEEKLIEQFQVVVDSREQKPYRFKNSIISALPYGDYTIFYKNKNYINRICVERKSNVSELFAFSGRHRERFERELKKLSEIEYPILLLEMDFMDIVNEQPPGILLASVVYGTLISFMVKYNIHIYFVHNRVNARAVLYKLFYNFVKYKILKIK